MNNNKAIKIEKISQEVKKNGFSLVEDWLTVEHQEKISEYIKKYKPQKGTNESLACTLNKEFIIEFLKLNFKKISLSLLLKDLAKKLQLKKIAEQIFDHDAQVIRTDFYYNKISNAPVLDWHCDNAYSGKENVKNFLHPDDFSIKFFFYLSDVYPDNGCLSYIPKSNIITYVLREAIYKKEIPYSPYWSLKDLRDQFKSENNVKFLNKKITKEDLDIFMKHSSDALNKSIKTNKFDFVISNTTRMNTSARYIWRENSNLTQKKKESITAKCAHFHC